MTSLSTQKDMSASIPQDMSIRPQRIHSIDTGLLFEQLLDLLKKQAPELSHIFEEMVNGSSQHEIERELGIAHGTMSNMVKKMRAILQQSVSREDIIG